MGNNLIKSVGIITLIAIVSKILGFGRELLMAAFFGASDVTDAFFVAQIIPVLMFTAVGMAITTGMAPIYANAKLNKGQEEAGNIISVLGTLFLFLSIAVTIVFYFLTPFITSVMAPGFNQEQTELTNTLTRIMLPSFCFYVMAAIMTGILEYEKRFAPPALVAIPQSLFIIIAIVFLSDTYGIYGIAVATLLGAAAQYLLQYPFIKKYRVMNINIHFKKYKSVIKDTLILFSPIIIASIAYQINAIVDKMVASQLPIGSVSALNYSNKLMYLPVSIILLPLITVLYPTVIDAAINKGKDLIKIIFKGLNLIFFISIPLMIVMLVESKELVDFAYKRGAFGEDASIMTTDAFFFYTFGMVFIALKEFLNRFYVAVKDTRITMIGSVAAIVINVILSVILSRFLEVGGIALATSIAMFMQTIFLFVFLPRRIKIHKSDISMFLKGFLKLLLIWIGIYFVTNYISHLYEGLHLIVQLVISTIITFVTFAIVSFLLKVEEMNSLLKMLKRRKNYVE